MVNNNRFSYMFYTRIETNPKVGSKYLLKISIVEGKGTFITINYITSFYEFRLKYA